MPDKTANDKCKANCKVKNKCVKPKNCTACNQPYFKYKHKENGKETYPKIQFTSRKKDITESCRNDRCYKMNANGAYIIYGKKNRKQCKQACDNNYAKLNSQYNKWLDCTKKYNTCMAPYNKCKDNLKKCEKKCNTTNPITYSPAELAAKAQDRACKDKIKAVNDKYEKKEVKDFLFFQKLNWHDHYKKDMNIDGCGDKKYNTNNYKNKFTIDAKNTGTNTYYDTHNIKIRDSAGWATFYSIVIIIFGMVILSYVALRVDTYLKNNKSTYLKNNKSTSSTSITNPIQQGGLKLPTVKYKYKYNY